MAARAVWKGYLTLGELSCAVALHTAASQSERIALHIVNRATGHRIRREFVDQETGDPIDRADQVKGYETAPGDYVVLEPDEIAAATPESDKILEISRFIACGGLDPVYFDRPYYLTPADRTAGEAFMLLAEAMRRQEVAALAQGVLFRRLRPVLIHSHGEGMIATTLKFDYEIRSAVDAFKGIEEHEIEGEMLDLARHIIETKHGTFDPGTFEDRYEQSLIDLIKAKREGRKLPKAKPVRPTKRNELLAALRRSATASGRKAG